MNTTVRTLFTAVCAACCAGAFAAGNAVTVTTGAGYIPVVKKIASVCRAQTNDPIFESYGGNIGQMLAQVRSGSGVNVIITDKTTLERMKTPVRFSVTQSLGKTPLMLIWRKGLELSSEADLTDDSIKAVAIPDTRAAVYGRAGTEWIASLSKDDSTAVKGKLMQVPGVPQVASYVVRGEVDAGFVNIQAARKNKDKLGGMKAITEGYAPIELVAVVVDGEEGSANVSRFLKCLESNRVKGILKQAGVE